MSLYTRARATHTHPLQVIAKKIQRCKTDSLEGMEWDNPARPECTNLLNIYKAVSGKTCEVRPFLLVFGA